MRWPAGRATRERRPRDRRIRAAWVRDESASRGSSEIWPATHTHSRAYCTCWHSRLTLSTVVVVVVRVVCRHRRVAVSCQRLERVWPGLVWNSSRVLVPAPLWPNEPSLAEPARPLIESALRVPLPGRPRAAPARGGGPVNANALRQVHKISIRAAGHHIEISPPCSLYPLKMDYPNSALAVGRLVRGADRKTAAPAKRVQRVAGANRKLTTHTNT
jgi:hypothetical protein